MSRCEQTQAMVIVVNELMIDISSASTLMRTR